MKKFIVGGLVAFLPVLASAATVGSGTLSASPFVTLLDQISNLINYLLPFLISLAVLVFFWGVVKYIMSGGDEASRAEGKSFMIWGLIAVVVMVSFWAIVGFIQNSIQAAGGSGDVSVTTAPGGISNMLPS